MLNFICMGFAELSGTGNKRPKGSHIVHLSTICHLFKESARATNFCLLIGPKNTNLVEDVEILLPVNFVEFCSAVLSEKSKMSQPIRGQGGHLVFPISWKNTNLVEDIEILLHVKFCWILFSGFRGEVQNVWVNQRPGRPSSFSDRPPQTLFFPLFFFLCTYFILYTNMYIMISVHFYIYIKTETLDKDTLSLNLSHIMRALDNCMMLSSYCRCKYIMYDVW